MYCWFYVQYKYSTSIWRVLCTHILLLEGIRFLCTVQVIRFLYRNGTYKSAQKCLRRAHCAVGFSSCWLLQICTFTISFNATHAERATPTGYRAYILYKPIVPYEYFNTKSTAPTFTRNVSDLSLTERYFFPTQK